MLQLIAAQVEATGHTDVTASTALQHLMSLPLKKFRSNINRTAKRHKEAMR
jgi:hypothetical protein